MSEEDDNRWSAWQRRVTILLSLVGLAVVSVLILPRLGFVRSFAQDKIVQMANQSLAGSIAIDDISAMSWTTVVAEGVTIRDARDNIVVRGDEARVRWSLLPIFSSTINLDEIVLVRPTAVVRTYEDGVVNLAIISEKSETESPPLQWLVTLESGTVESGRIIYWDETVAGPAPEGLGELSDDALKSVSRRTTKSNDSFSVLDAKAVGLSTSATIDLTGPLSVDVDRLESDLGIDLVGERTDVLFDETRVRYDEPYLSVSADTVRASTLASLGGISIQTKFGETTRDIVASAVVSTLSVEPRLPGIFMSDSPIASTVRGELRAGLKEGRVDANAQLSTAEGGTIDVAARFDDIDNVEGASWSAGVSGQNLVLDKWTPLGDPVKRGSVRIWARGDGTQPKTATGQGTVWASDLLVDKYTINEALLDLRWDDGELVVDRLKGRSPYAALDARGAIAMSGQYAVSLDLQSRDAISEVTSGLVSFGDDAGGFVSLSSNGTLDFDADQPARMLVDGELKGRWNLDEFAAEDINVESSSGTIDVRVDKAVDNGSRRLRADIDAQGRNIRGAGYRVSSFDARVDADSTFRPPYADVSDFTRRLDSTVDLRVSGLSGPGVSLASARVDLDTDDRGASTFGYKLGVDVSSLRSGSTRVGAARADLRGSMTIGSGQRLRDILNAVAVKGSAGVQGVDAGAAQVDTAAVELDVKGQTQDLTGRVELAARGADFGQYDFKSLTAILKLTGDREFEIDVDGTQQEGTPKSFDATVLGSYAANLKSYTIRDIRFAAGDQEWSFSDGFSFSPQKGRYTFDDVTITHQDQRVRIDGYFEQGRDQDLTFEAEDVSIADIRKTIGMEPAEGEPDIRGRISMTGSLKGTSKDPNATFDVWIRDIYVDERGPFDLHLVGRYGDDLLDLDTLEGWAYQVRVLAGAAEVPFDGTLEGKAEILWDAPFLLDLQVPRVEIARFHNAVPALEELGARGEVELGVKLSGRLSAPDVSLSVSGDSLAVEGELDKKPLAVGPYDLRIDSEYEPGAAGAAGNLATTGALTRGRTDLGRKLVDLSLDLTVDAPGWISDLLEGRDVDWVGRLMKLPYDIEATVNSYDLRSLGLATMTEADAEGVVDVKLSGDATIGDPQLELDATLNDFGWNRYRDVVVDLKANLDDDLVTIQNVRLEWDKDEILRGSGEVPFPTGVMAGRAKLQDLPVDLQLQLSRLPIAKFQAVDYSFASIRGTIGGYLTVSGRLSDPTLSSRISIVDTMFADRTTGTVAVDLTANDDRVDLIAQICQGAKPTVDLRASFPMNLDIPAVAKGEDLVIDGALSGRMVASRVDIASVIPEKILDNYLSEVRGVMSADVKLAGSVEEPHVLGDLVVQDAAIFLQDYGRQLSEIDLDVSFRPDGIRVKELEVRDGRGSVEATGKLQMTRFQPEDMRFRVRADEFGTAGFTPMPMFVTADVDLRGVVDQGLVDGDIDVSSLEVKIPETATGDSYDTELSPDIVLASNLEESSEDGFLSLDQLSQQTESSGQSLARFTVEIARDSWVRHPIGDVNLTGSLDIEVAPSGATIGGEIEAIRGDFKLLGKRFEVRRGVVTFTGANPPTPRLDVEAVHLLDRSLTESIGQPTTGNPRVIVEVSGTSEEPELNLTSDPQMPEDDIIYVLVTGRPPSSTGVGEREGVASTALSAASGIFAGILQDKLEGTIPVDVLRVESGDEGIGDYRVEAGKYITESLFLSLQYNFGAEKDENATTVSIEYRFAPRWTLEFEAGDEANGEANVFWDVY